MASRGTVADVDSVRLLRVETRNNGDSPDGIMGRRAAACTAVALATGLLALGAVVQFGQASRQHDTSLLSHAASLAATTAMSTYRIKSTSTGHCLDSGAVVVRSKPCDESNAKEEWTYNSTSNHIKVPDGRCLDEGGANVHIWSCASKGVVANNQHWHFDIHTGQIKHLAASEELCLQDGGSQGKVTMKRCDKSNEGQKWSLHAHSVVPTTAPPRAEATAAEDAMPSGFAVISHKKGGCLDAGGKIHMWPCDPSNANQQWTHTSSGLIKSRNGGCLDAASSTSLRPCSDDSGYQSWTLNVSSGLLEVHDGDLRRCLKPQALGHKGSAVFLEACDEHSGGERWDLEDLATASQQSGGSGSLIVVALVSCMALGACVLCYLYHKEMQKQDAERQSRSLLPTNDPEAPAEAEAEGAALTAPEAAPEAGAEAAPEAGAEAAPEAGAEAAPEAQAETNTQAEAGNPSKKDEEAQQPPPGVLGA